MHRGVTVWLLCWFASAALAADGDIPTQRHELAAFIRQQLDVHNVPGASVVVIRSNRVSWVGSFGVANTLTRRAVTPETVFPVASNGKPITAYLAAVLAVRGAIDLDRPVRAQVRVDLPQSPQHDRITPRHLLTHSSGLGNFLRDRRRAVAFAPGTRFAYSGVGFMVLQELLERRTGRTLDQLAMEEVFEPAGMRSSWFSARPDGPLPIAAPHMPLFEALIPFSLVVGPLVALLILIVTITGRWRRGKWTLSWFSFAASYGIASVFAFAFLLQRSGSPVLALWFSLIPFAALSMIVVLLRAAHRRGRITELVCFAAIVATCIAVAVAGARVSVPLPTIELGKANAASSLRATAPALARLMIELSRPDNLDSGAVALMTMEQTVIGDASRWGLGIGIEAHGRGGDLWHWGSNPGAKSIMIICPETGDGVVVLTNGSEGSDAMRKIAAKVMGRTGCWHIVCSPAG